MLKIRCDDGAKRHVMGSCVLTLAPGERIAIDLASGGHWYGHGFNHVQPYPLETGEVVNGRFAVNNIQSPIWLCSAGYALLADTNAMLSVSINKNGDDKLILHAPENRVALRVFRGTTLPEAWTLLMRHLGVRTYTPPVALLGDSFFCSWTQYPRCVSQERVIGMARAIREHGFPCSTLIIDDRWEACYGELEFSADFPDPRAMVDELHNMGFAVWLWVTPFVNVEGAHFSALTEKQALVMSEDGTEAATFRWWGGTAGLIDLTGEAGRNWYRDRLLALRERFGIDGFKIDGGDFKYQPTPGQSRWADYAGPSGYCGALLALFEEIAPGACESRSAWLSQRRNIIWREGGKDSHWGLDNGLKAMVTLGLHLGLLGYGLLIPDMAPGRVQTMQADMPLPTDELMVRWTEASAFFPLLQFSYFPWNYASNTLNIVRAYSEVHKAIAPYVRSVVATSRKPLIRPLWFDAPYEKHLYVVSDQFMVGPDLLVAPILEAGAASREVVLPPGTWRDVWNGTEHGAGLIEQHEAPCPGIPLFVRTGNPDLFSHLNGLLQTVPRGSVVSGETSATYTAGINRDLSVTG